MSKKWLYDYGMRFFYLYRKIIFKISKTLPDNLLSKNLVTVFAILFILQISFAIVFYDQSWRKIKRSLINNIVNNIASLIITANKTDSYEELKLVVKEFRDYSTLNPVLYNISNPSFLGTVNYDNEIVQQIEEYVPNIVYVNAYNDKYSILKISVHIRDEYYVSLYLDKQLFLTKSIHYLLSLITIIYLIAVLLIRFLIKKQLKPLKQLYNSAKKLAKGQSVNYIIPKGAIEIRETAIAFNEMNAQLMKLIQQKNLLFSSVSHDIKTALTRMHLMLDFTQDLELKEMLQNEINYMNNVLISYLALTKEQYENTEVNDKIKLVIKDFFDKLLREYYYSELKITVKYLQFTEYLIINETVLERIVVNILDNAHRYATKVDIIITNLNSYNIKLSFIDNGGGIEDLDVSNVGKPFAKLSNNIKDNNFGLGFYTIKDLAAKNGGNVKINNVSDPKGLRIDIILPVM